MSSDKESKNLNGFYFFYFLRLSFLGINHIISLILAIVLCSKFEYRF